MYAKKADAGKRPVLRIIPKEPRPWRLAWREALERVRREKAA
jgi:hypothetical protein